MNITFKETGCHLVCGIFMLCVPESVEEQESISHSYDYSDATLKISNGNNQCFSSQHDLHCEKYYYIKKNNFSCRNGNIVKQTQIRPFRVSRVLQDQIIDIVIYRHFVISWLAGSHV